MSTPKRRAEATELVDKFESKKKPGWFRQFNRKEVADGLRARIAQPSRIGQESTQLCGVAAFLYVLASDQPRKYAGFVAELYDSGTTSVFEAYEHWSGMRINPGEHLRDYRPPSRDINPADWSAMASIRDSENWVFDYKTVKSSARRGGTSSSDIVKWLWRFGGYDMVKNECNGFFNKDEQHLHRANALYMQKFRVLLLVDHDCLVAGENSLWSSGPDHWVVMTSPIRIKANEVNLTVYTWGARLPVIQNRIVNKADFLQHYYGFVAAKF